MQEASLLLPVFLRLEGRPVLVVGAGAVGTKRIEELLEVGARVVVIATAAHARVQAHAAAGRLTLHLRGFQPEDVEGMWWVISATGDPEVARTIWETCERERVFVTAVDDPAHCSAFFGGVLRRPPFQIAISSSGAAPALTRLLREVLEAALPPERWIQSARELRRQWKDQGTPMHLRFTALLARLQREPTWSHGEE